MVQFPAVTLAAIYWVFRGLDEQRIQRQVVTDGILRNNKETSSHAATVATSVAVSMVVLLGATNSQDNTCCVHYV